MRPLLIVLGLALIAAGVLIAASAPAASLELAPGSVGIAGEDFADTELPHSRTFQPIEDARVSGVTLHLWAHSMDTYTVTSEIRCGGQLRASRTVDAVVTASTSAFTLEYPGGEYVLQGEVCEVGVSGSAQVVWSQYVLWGVPGSPPVGGNPPSPPSTTTTPPIAVEGGLSTQRSVGIGVAALGGILLLVGFLAPRG